MRPPLFVALTVAASVAMAVPLALALQRPPMQQEAPLGTDPARVEALEARFERLERMAQARPQLGTPGQAESNPRRVADEPAADRAAVQALSRRVEALEQRLDAAERRSGPARAADPGEAQRAAAEAQRAVADAQSTLLDPGASNDAKIEAHRQLRRVRDAYTPQMVADLLRIATTDPRGETRAAVWTFFDGSSHLPQLVPHLLRALAHDGDARAREEAAETLGNYTANDAAVLPALKQAAQHDADSRVRSKAQRTLRGDPQEPPLGR